MNKPLHEYFQGTNVDMAKMREEAHRRSVGDMHRGPQDCVIHFHKHGQSCDGQKHEYFPPKDEEKTNAEACT